MPTNHRHLRTLLTTWSKQPEGQEYGRLQRLVGVVVVTAMLDGLRGPDGEERIGYKGGAALQLRFGFRARASKDLDAAFRGEIAEALGLIGEAVQRGWNGFTGLVGEPEEITRPGIDPPPMRVQIKVAYKGRHVLSVPFELSRAEGRSLDNLERLQPAISLAPARIPDPEPVTLMPLPYQIAQKLHACTEPETEERRNGRAHDVHDLLLIQELAQDVLDLAVVRKACVEIFEGRDQHGWPPVVAAPPGWVPLWDRLQVEEGIPYTLDEAIALANALVESIDAATGGE